MAINDMEFNAGLNITEVKGADKVAYAFADGVSKGVENLLKKRKRFETLYDDIKARGRAENLEDALYYQNLYNKALGTSYERVRSEDVDRELRMLREGNRLLIGGFRSGGRKEEIAESARKRWLASASEVERMQETGEAYKYKNRGNYLSTLHVALENMDVAYRTAKAAGTLTHEEQKDYYKDRPELVKEIRKNTFGIKKLTDVFGGYKTITVAGAAGAAFGSKMSSVAAGLYGNMNTPFDQIRNIGNQVAKGVGGAIGAVLGGVLGTIVPGVGNVVGSAVGGAIGSFVGGMGERAKAASDAAKPEAIAMLRYRSLYGNRVGAAGYNAAIMAQQTGFVGAGDIMGMAAGSNTFMSAAAFGGIGEQQWLALSMMPNYYNALVSGASVEEQMMAYKRDMDVLGPGLGQYMTGLLGGLGPNENIRAFVQSDSFDKFISDYAQFVDWEREQERYASGYASAQYNEGKRNMALRNFNIRRGTFTSSVYNYDDASNRVQKAYMNMLDANERLGIREYNRSTGAFDGNKNLVQRELNIIIEGEKVNVGTVYATEEDLHNYMSYSAGGR